MKVVNLLFNHKKSSHDYKVLGVERCFIDYSKYLIECGAEVLSVFKKGIYYFDEVKETKSQVLQVRAINKGDIFSIVQLAVSLFKFKPDVAICHSGRALFLTRVARFLSRRKFTIIAINHGSNIKKFLKADYILSVNSYSSNEIIKAGKPKDRSLVIPNMMKVPDDFQKIKKSSFRNPIRLGSLSRISGEKSFDILLKAMSVLRDRNIDSEFYLGGVGTEEGNLKKLAKELNLESNFKILGWTSDKKNFFENIDIFVLPSRYETFGIVLIEAMLYSTPIVTTNTWGPKDIITQGVHGLRVSRDDVDKMPELIADEIERLVSDEDFAKELAENAHQEFLNKYTAEVVSKKLYQLCIDVAPKR